MVWDTRMRIDYSSIQNARTFLCLVVMWTGRLFKINELINNSMNSLLVYNLTHWGRVTHICVSKLTIIVSDNGLSPNRRQAIIWTNAGILLIGPLGINFSEISIEIYIFSSKKMHLKMSSGNWQPSCLGLNVLTTINKVNQSHVYHLWNIL